MSVFQHGGGLPPVEAWVCVARGEALLVDVRSAEELKFVGQVPGSVHVAWATGTALTRNPHSGLYMRIRHSSGAETFYGHLSRTMPGLKAGGVLRAGDVLGLVGESGFATGPHLHYEVIVNGSPIDPESSRYVARMVSLR